MIETRYEIVNPTSSLHGLSIFDIKVQQGILEIVRLQMFSELLWVSTFQHISGLAEGNRQGRLADLFPEEVQGRDDLLGPGLVATLLTVVGSASSSLMYK